MGAFLSHLCLCRQENGSEALSKDCFLKIEPRGLWLDYFESLEQNSEKKDWNIWFLINIKFLWITKISEFFGLMVIRNFRNIDFIILDKKKRGKFIWKYKNSYKIKIFWKNPKNTLNAHIKNIKNYKSKKIPKLKKKK